MTGDAVERSIGPMGRWQILVCLTVFAVKFSVAWHQLCIVFLAPPVEFTCAVNSTGACSPDCPEHRFDDSLFGSTIITQWDLVCDRAQLANVAQLIFMSGILVGNVAFGWFADRYGRRRPLVYAVILQVVSGVAIAFSPYLWLFMVLRFICAFATGGTMLTSFVLVMEIVGAKWRTFIGTVFQIPFNLGHASLAIFGYFIRDWTVFQLAISVPSVLLISYWWLIPESPRWLLTVGRTKEALETMKKAARVNKLPEPKSATAEAGSERTKDDSSSSGGGRVTDLFRTKTMATRTLYVCCNWTVIGLCFFGVAQFMGQIGGDIFVNVAVSGLVQVPGTLFSIFLMNYLGRKRTLLVSYALSGAACLAIAAIPEGSDPGGVATSALGSVGMFALAIAFSTVYVYTGELLPTVLRNVGIGTASMFARFGSMAAPFVAGLAADGSSWTTPVIFGVAPAIAFVTCLPLPETLGCSLPDTVEDAENIRGRQ